MVEKRTWLLWWWQAAASDYRLPPLLPISAFCAVWATPDASQPDYRGRLCSFPGNSATSSPGFLSNQNHMTCKFTGKLRSPFGSGSKTFSQRTTRWNGEWTVAAAAAAAPPRDGWCVYDHRVPANVNTLSVLLFFSCGVVVSSLTVALLLDSVGGLLLSCSGWVLFACLWAVCLETVPKGARRNGHSRALNLMTARLAAL